jgi:HK97 family phage portal protein
MVAPQATEETVRGLSAYRRGQRLIARTIGMMPLDVHRNGVMVDETTPLTDRPVPWMSRQAAVESMVETLIDWGNYFAILTQFDYRGYPQGIIPIHPRFVSVTLTTSGLLYRVGGQVVYSSSDMMHIRTGSPAGDLLGRGVLETSPASVRTGAAVAAASQYFYADGVYPAGILEVEDPDISEDDAEQLRDQFMSKARRGQPVVLPAGIVWKAVVAPNAEQAQLVHAQDSTRREIADLLDLEADWLGIATGRGMTYKNIIDRLDELIKLTCMPWMAAIEDAFTQLTPRPTGIRFDPDELLRADTTTRYTNYVTGLTAGFLTLEEVRAEESMPPLPEPAAGQPPDQNNVQPPSVAPGGAQP